MDSFKKNTGILSEILPIIHLGIFKDSIIFPEFLQDFVQVLLHELLHVFFVNFLGILFKNPGQKSPESFAEIPTMIFF